MEGTKYKEVKCNGSKFDPKPGGAVRLYVVRWYQMADHPAMWLTSNAGGTLKSVPNYLSTWVPIALQVGLTNYTILCK